MIIASPTSRTQGLRLRADDPRLVSAALLAALAMMVAGLLVDRPRATQGAPAAAPARALAFVPNQGQSDPRVRYEASVTGGRAFFTDRAVVLSFARPDASTSMRISFEGAAAAPALEPDSRLAGVENIVSGSDPAGWHLNMPTYAALRYREIYPGVALRYEGTDGALKSTYELAPAADPSAIAWRYEGASDVRLDPATGDLQIALAGVAPLVERAPVAWQDVPSGRRAVPVRYDLRADGSVGFSLGAYDPSAPLTIDPTLEFSTYLGGSGADQINAVAVDPATGDIFVAGQTNSSPFPGSPTTFGTVGPGTFPNVFVARVAANGGATVYRTVLGGINSDVASAISVVGGVANVVGTTSSSDFPTAGTPYQAAYGGSGDMFAVALSGAGALTYGTYIGGASADVANGVAASGSILYIAGATDGVFPNATAPVGGSDVIVLKIDKTAGTAVQYVTRIGGLGNDVARAVALDGALNAYITGFTSSNAASPPAFPTVGTPLQPNSGGGQDAFIAQINAAGTPVYSSYLGGAQTDKGNGIAVDPAGGVVYLTGETLSSDFPGVSAETLQGQDAFVTKINLSTNITSYAHFLGSPGVDSGNAIAVDAAGAAYVVGQTSSTSFYSLNPLPEMAGRGGNVDGFVTRYDPAGAPSYSTRLGGALDDIATSVATAQTAQGAKIYVGGYTGSTDFPMTTPATSIQPTNGGQQDAFLVRISNQRPVADLNGAAAGLDFGPTTWTEAGGAVAGSGPVVVVSASGLTVTDPDNPGLAYAEARFVNTSGAADGTAVVPPDAAAESLAVTLSGGITGSYSPATGVLRLTSGPGSTLADFQAVLRTLAYNNTSNTPTAGPRRIAVELSDGIDTNLPLAIATVTVVATNDPPAITVPGSGPTLSEEGTAVVTGVSVADPDAGAGTLQATLSVPAASGTLAASAVNAAVVTGSGTSSVQITGNLTDLNATLATLQFTGALDFNTNSGGADSPATLTVVVSDQGNTPAPPLSDTKTLGIRVNPVNDAPVGAASPSVTVIEDTPKTVAVVADLGFTDAKDLSAPAAPGGAPLLPLTSITVTTPPTSGTITSISAAAGTFVYTPSANANGADSFAIQVCDSGTPGSACTTKTVSVSITAVNDAPSFTKGADVSVAEDSGAFSQAGWATAISAGPADEAGQTLTFSVTGNTNAALFSAGPAVAADGTLTFTPAPNAVGSATVTIKLTDNGGTANGGVDASATQSFVITITPVNDAPSFTPGADVTVNEDSGAYSQAWATAISPGPSDESAQTVSFAITGNTNPTLFSAGPTLAPNGTLAFTPAANASGFSDITITLQDNGGTASGGVDTSAPVTFRITVSPVNDAPSFTKGADVTVQEDSGAYSQAGWATAISPGPSDESAQTVSFVITGNTNAGLFSAGPAVAPNGTLTFTPAPNAAGVATITVAAQDNGGTAGGGVDTSAGQTFTITITGINDAPSFTPGADVTVGEDSGAYSQGWATAISPGPSDESAQTVSFSVTNNTNAALFSAGPALAPNGTLTFTPAPNAVGFADITVTLQDSGGTASGGVDTSAPVTFRITVTPVNDAPSFTKGADVTVAEDSGALSQAGWATAISPGPSDESAQTVSFVITANTYPGLFSAGPAVASNGTLTFTPAPNAHGVATVTVAARDSGGTAGGGVDTSAGQTFTITITSVNDGAPVAQPDSGAANNGPVTIDVAANDTDPADSPFGAVDPLSVTIATQPSHGTATVDPATGLVTYTPDPVYIGTDSFTYTICDVEPLPASVLCSTPGTVTVSVTRVNHPPIAIDDRAHALLDGPTITIAVLANDSVGQDVGETLSVVSVGAAAHGTAALVGGAVQYTPAAGYHGVDSFTYTIDDGYGGQASATVYVQVGNYEVALPLVLGQPTQPDLVVTDFRITPAGPSLTGSDQVLVSVTVKNTGTLATGGFWVDFYENPVVQPTAAGQRWEKLCTLNPCEGIAWYVSGGLLGGQSITLTSTKDSYFGLNTRWRGVLPPGASDLYVYVDSWNGSVTTGAVQESDEGNNRAEIHGLRVTPASLPSQAGEGQPLPESRPLPADMDRRRDEMVP